MIFDTLLIDFVDMVSSRVTGYQTIFTIVQSVRRLPLFNKMVMFIRNKDSACEVVEKAIESYADDGKDTVVAALLTTVIDSGRKDLSTKMSSKLEHKHSLRCGRLLARHHLLNLQVAETHVPLRIASQSHDV